jgi:hypothetical protein
LPFICLKPQPYIILKHNTFNKLLLPLCISIKITTGLTLSASIDNSVVLKIGPLEVSQYVVLKRYNPFRESLQSEAGDASKEVSSWFEDFLVNQVVTAKAISEGYTIHPDVIALVDRIERHMLTSVNGPYYQAILSDATRSEDEIRKLYLEDSTWNENTPFAGYFRMIQRQDMDRAVQQHRSVVLENVQFSVDQKNCDKLLERLKKLPLVPANIPIGLLEDEGDILLASYIQDGVIHSVEASEWIKYFGLLFIRSIPTSDITLKRSIEDMIIAAVDIEAARALGLDNELQFAEDRKHYLNAQALEWFEREKLIPKITISEAAIETYYQQHQEDFLRPVAAKGVLLKFKDGEVAMKWLQSHGKQSDKLKAEDHIIPDSSEEVEFTQAHPIPSLKPIARAILNAADGRPFGPIPTEDGFLIFLKQSSVKEQLPLADTTGYIVEKLTRDRLHEMEKELATEYCMEFEIEDDIAYEDFGVETVKTPWSD